MKIAVITDNQALFDAFQDIFQELENDNLEVSYFHSRGNDSMSGDIHPIHVKSQTEYLVSDFELIISLHCKQLFPTELVKAVRCINIHPGLNPYNRGWYPQVFSLINKLPIGATIHEIDEKLDHGDIIVQEEVKQFSYDTSLSLYNRVQAKEIELIRENITEIIENTYQANQPSKEGNLNLKKDFNELRKLDLDDVGTFRQHIDILRALSHGSHKNAYFMDELGNKVFVKIDLQQEKENTLD